MAHPYPASTVSPAVSHRARALACAPALLLIAALFACGADGARRDAAVAEPGPADGAAPADADADRGADAAAPPACAPGPTLTARVDPARMLGDLQALVGLGERRSHGAQQQAAAYLRAQLAALPGITLNEHTYGYRGLSYVNLEATIPGTEAPEELVIAGAHYDSASNDAQRAPGADDNASGTVAVLEAARALAGCGPRRSIRLLFFSNEELGAVGAQAYVQSLVATVPRERVRGMINVDTVAFGPPDEDLDLATKPAYSALAQTIAGAVQRWTTLKTKQIVSDHCG